MVSFRSRLDGKASTFTSSSFTRARYGSWEPGAILGHVGDGNYHVVFAIDPANAQELAEVAAINKQMVQKAISLDGTCTGEHGIGTGKIDYLRQEHGDAVDLMRVIKQAIDPHAIMNPGKVLPD